MNKILFSLSIIALFNNCTTQKTTYEDEIKLVQYALNTEFADASTSPLTTEDLKTFKGLDFFEINEIYKVEAKFVRTPNSPIIEMRTTTEEKQLYKKYAIAHFILNGKELELSIYQSLDLIRNPRYNNYLFLPFNDATNGTLTYGGGRYIDLEIPSEERETIVIDFNKAYNPYCAYNHKYSCPIPPSENNLSITIPVGIKDFRKHH